MTDMRELLKLVSHARDAGAEVKLTFDQEAWEEEGRTIISTVQVKGLHGIGEGAMPALACAERLRDFVAKSAGFEKKGMQ